MKIIEASAGALTNFEVLDLLRSRGAGKDPTRAIASVSTSEFEVFNYLENSAACNQTRDVLNKLVGECKKFDLAQAEVLNIANIRPTSTCELFLVLGGSDPLQRLDETAMDELVETIMQVLPPDPTVVEESNEETAEGEEEAEQPEPNTVVEESNEETAEGVEEAEQPEPNTVE